MESVHVRVAELLSQMGFEEDLKQDILQTGRPLKIIQGQSLIEPGMKAAEMPLVVSGVLRVMREEDSGRELLLYDLEGGDACAMSISCCLGNQLSSFKAVAEEDTWLWMVAMSQIDHWLARYQSFRKFIFDAYHNRFDEMLSTVDSIAFMNMDERLMKYLLDKKQSTGSYIIHKTHEQIAQELNTSRVVVSRLLKKLERQEKIELHRNRIEVL